MLSLIDMFKQLLEKDMKGMEKRRTIKKKR